MPDGSRLFSNWTEVLEHASDVQALLANSNKVRIKESFHPDHNCWYTPYTFSNVLRKYTTWRLDGLWLFHRLSLLALLTKLPAQE